MNRPAPSGDLPGTLTALAAHGLSQWPDGVALASQEGASWRTFTAREVTERVRALALGLDALGVRKGDRVVLHAENSAEWVMVDLAVASLGAVLVPIYTTQPGDQIRYIVEDAGASVYVVSSEVLFGAIRPHLQALSCLEHLIGIEASFAPEMMTLDELAAKGNGLNDTGRWEALQAAVRPDDLLSIIYTSGTTGMPKGVMLTHRNVVSNVLGSLERLPFDPGPDRRHRLLSYLPLSHVFERIVMYIGLHVACPIYFVADFTTVMEAFRSVEPVHFATVPRLLEKVYLGIRARAEGERGVRGALLRWALRLAEAYDVEQRWTPWTRLRHRLADRLVFRHLRELFGRNIRAITSGGAALSADMMNFFNALGIFCGQGYGMTETSPVLTAYDRHHLRAGSVGKPISGVELRIDEDGEILARGPNVMAGYHNLPDATREVFTEDGWLRTGDIGEFDKDGFLFITDRKKALLKLSTGKYVAPQPIEVRLTGGAFIEQAVVVGNGYKFCAALLVPNWEALRNRLGEENLSPGDEKVRALIQHDVDRANEGLPPWEQVKRFRLLDAPLTVEAGELTPTLKVKRRVIYTRYAAEIASLYD